MGRKDCCLRNWAAVGLRGCQRANLSDSSAWGRPELAAAACCMQLQRQFAGPEGAHCLFQGPPSLPAKVVSQHAAERSLLLKPLQLKSIPCSLTPAHLTQFLSFLLSERRALQKVAWRSQGLLCDCKAWVSQRQAAQESSPSHCYTRACMNSVLPDSPHTHAMQAVFALDVPAAQPHQVSAQGAPETSLAAHSKPSNNDENGDASMKAPTAAESAGPSAGQAHPDKATWSIERPAGLQEVLRWCRAQQMRPLLQGQLQASHRFSLYLACLVEGASWQHTMHLRLSRNLCGSKWGMRHKDTCAFCMLCQACTHLHETHPVCQAMLPV